MTAQSPVFPAESPRCLQPGFLTTAQDHIFAFPDEVPAPRAGARNRELPQGNAAGSGLLELSRIGATTAVTRCRSNSPLKLLAPRGRGAAAWVFASTYGGGLLAGDAIRLDVRAGAGTACLLGTQASTKIYRSPAGLPSAQEIRASVGDGALLVVAPEPVSAFAGAVFEQRQRFDLAADASLVLVDWLTSGRRARGERWAFSRYRSRNEIDVAGRTVFRDSLLLDAADGPIGGPQRMGRFECLGMAVLLGPQMRSAADAMLGFVAGQPVRREANLLFSASPLAGGVMVRVAATSTELVSDWLRARLAFISDLVGGNPLTRGRQQ